MDLFSTDALIGMIEALDRPQSFLLDTFFPDERLFETETVYIDKLNFSRKLAPLVSPVVAGKARRERGYQTMAIKPAYVKPKHVVEPGQTLKRRAGEKLTGSLDPLERYQMIVAQNMQLEDEEITRREEWMASTALRTGAITLSGDDFPTLSVDFGRNAGHTIQLTSTARWGEAGVSPLKNIRDWAVTVHRNSGAHPGKVIMDPLAAQLFLADSEVRTILHNRRQDGGVMQLAPQATGAQGEEYVYLGSLAQFEYWQYSALYTLEDGTLANFMPDYTVIMGAPRLAEGVRAYGAIQDKRALRAMKRFPKMWDDEDPAVTYTMTQSAPIVALGRADATFCATVR